jgi:hypothetical protein
MAHTKSQFSVKQSNPREEVDGVPKIQEFMEGENEFLEHISALESTKTEKDVSDDNWSTLPPLPESVLLHPSAEASLPASVSGVWDDQDIWAPLPTMDKIIQVNSEPVVKEEVMKHWGRPKESSQGSVSDSELLRLEGISPQSLSRSGNSNSRFKTLMLPTASVPKSALLVECASSTATREGGRRAKVILSSAANSKSGIENRILPTSQPFGLASAPSYTGFVPSYLEDPSCDPNVAPFSPTVIQTRQATVQAINKPRPSTGDGAVYNRQTAVELATRHSSPCVSTTTDQDSRIFELPNFDFGDISTYNDWLNIPFGNIPTVSAVSVNPPDLHDANNLSLDMVLHNQQMDLSRTYTDNDYLDDAMTPAPQPMADLSAMYDLTRPESFLMPPQPYQDHRAPRQSQRRRATSLDSRPVAPSTPMQKSRSGMGLGPRTPSPSSAPPSRQSSADRSRSSSVSTSSGVRKQRNWGRPSNPRNSLPSAAVDFVNFTPEDCSLLMTGVAPSGSSKTKARREREAAERRRQLSEAAVKAVRAAGGDVDLLKEEGIL